MGNSIELYGTGVPAYNSGTITITTSTATIGAVGGVGIGSGIYSVAGGGAYYTDTSIPVCFCPECKTELNINAKFCSQCGLELKIAEKNF